MNQGLEELIQEFKEEGVIVFENVFSDQEVDEIRNKLHKQLLEHGIDHQSVLNGTTDAPKNVRIKSDVARIFYNKWKIDAHLDQRVYDIMKYLHDNTFADGKTKNFEHQMGTSTDILAYIDRICYRMPDKILKEGGLGLHIDRNIKDPYLLKSGGLLKWRPIQGFIALTDHYGSESGGLKCVKGFHKIIDDYFANNTEISDISNNKGEFFRMISKSHAKIERECQPIIAPRGSLVCWDNRLPHST